MFQLRTGEEKVKNKMMIDAEKEKKIVDAVAAIDLCLFRFVPEKDNFFCSKRGRKQRGPFPCMWS